jgi:membrane protein implicated in regulation of membrane protease activity
MTSSLPSMNSPGLLSSALFGFILGVTGVLLEVSLAVSLVLVTLGLTAGALWLDARRGRTTEQPRARGPVDPEDPTAKAMFIGFGGVALSIPFWSGDWLQQALVALAAMLALYLSLSLVQRFGRDRS